MKNQALSTTELYFKLSNQGDLDAISSLFHRNATYSSSQTGLYFGTEDIMAMMQAFFAAFKHLYWHIDDIKPLTEHIVEVSFSCTSIDWSDTKSHRHGIEKVVVVDNLIKHIEIRAC